MTQCRHVQGSACAEPRNSGSDQIFFVPIPGHVRIFSRLEILQVSLFISKNFMQNFDIIHQNNNTKNSENESQTSCCLCTFQILYIISLLRIVLYVFYSDFSFFSSRYFFSTPAAAIIATPIRMTLVSILTPKISIWDEFFEISASTAPTAEANSFPADSTALTRLF